VKLKDGTSFFIKEERYTQIKKYHVVERDKYYFRKNYPDSTKKLSETDVI
jgi:hypothetical protein